MLTSWAGRLALGLALGALWRAGHRYAAAPLPGLVSWPVVRATALAFCRRDRAAAPAPAVAAAYERRVATSVQLVARYVGTRLPQPLDKVHVLSRAGWIEANLVGLRQLLDPLADASRAGEPKSVGNHASSGATQMLLSLQLGVLLGFLARRVLGQYDLALLGSEPVVQGRLYFVEANIAALEQRLGLPAEDFRLWIALHETTHAFEFEAHPWLREHLAGLLRRYLQSLGPDVLSWRPTRAGQWAMLARLAGNALQSRYVVEIVMSPEQREVFRAVQAAMAVLEGFSNHVMDRVGAGLIADYPDLRARFERRLTERGLLERLAQQLTGLHVKLEQYVLGERFVNAVVERLGIAGANLLLSGPSALPTLDELHEPQSWLARVPGAAP
ncbi:MAG: zinc-dependent metalloprotease [Chloroflexi bacterium]|nr:zinc-dependent metalloprotease [Chloroflexota bacterium]MBI4505649.1 zinc-dependent metalloprotease [Chloroflexota bacterium]